MTQLQIDTWKKTPLAVNTEPDISNVGNRQVQDLAVRFGCWLRSDSLIMDEPIQIEALAHRPPWLATILEDGANRHYVLPNMRTRTSLLKQAAGVDAGIRWTGQRSYAHG